jgi:hypothetical protein
MLALLPDRSAAAPAPCPPGRIRCRGECIDPAFDHRYCGGCPGVNCIKIVDAGFGVGCDGGVCRCGQASSEQRLEFCPGVGCVDTANDRRACGPSCTPCPRGQGCFNGECDECPPGTFACRGVKRCVDFATDEEHCGGCGRRCPGGATCKGPEVGCECPSGMRVCDDRGSKICKDTDNDRNFCGRSCKQCRGVEVCVGGVCQCPPDSAVRCRGRCIDPNSDGHHCGGCPGVDCTNVATAGHGLACVAGACVCTDPSERFCPPVGCVDTDSDPRACGPGCTPCKKGEPCHRGVCGACLEGKRLCGQSCCPDEATCRQHVCICPSGKVFCGEECVAACAAPKELNQTTCRCECPSTLPACAAPKVRDPDTCECVCPSGRAPCGQGCCPAGESCVGGVCQQTACPPGTTRCGSACVNLQTDNNNCGCCGRVCPPYHECRLTGSGSPYCFQQTALADTHQVSCSGTGPTDFCVICRLTEDGGFTWCPFEPGNRECCWVTRTACEDCEAPLAEFPYSAYLCP